MSYALVERTAGWMACPEPVTSIGIKMIVAVYHNASKKERPPFAREACKRGELAFLAQNRYSP